MTEHSPFDAPSPSEKPKPPMPENTAEGIILSTPEKQKFEETLESLDANIPEGSITYAQMFNELPSEMQATIQQYYTNRNTIASAIIGGHNRLLQNKKDGIDDSPTLPVATTIWKRHRPSMEGRPPLPPESDFKRRAASDKS